MVGILPNYHAVRQGDNRETFSAYTLLLTPLSPIHIGTGDSYEPTNYVIEGDTLHEFDTAAVMDTLTAIDRQALNGIVNRASDDAMLRAVQKFFHDRRATLATRAVHRIPVQSGVVKLYEDRIGRTAQQEGGRRRIMNQLEINRTAYNSMTRLPVLLGSSMKGAIRTALLDGVNAGRSTTERKGLHEFQGKGDLFRYYQGRLFPERDPMRLVHISDAVWNGEPELPATEVVFAVNRKKTSVVDRHGCERGTRADSGPPQILECIPLLRYRAFTGQLNVQALGEVNKPGQVPAADLQFNLSRIAELCNQFYRPILQKEIELLSRRGWLERTWAKIINDVLVSPVCSDGGAFVLRIGRHCGAESVTLNGVRKIRIMAGRGHSNKEGTNATTIWLAAKEREQVSGLLPFGWALVEFAPLRRGGHENSAVKALCEQSLGAARQWADRVKAKESVWGREPRFGQAPEPPGKESSGLGVTQPRSSWVDKKLEELCIQPGRKIDDQLRSKALAEAVKAVEDKTIQKEAMADIVNRWKAKGWWEKPAGKSAKEAKAIYDEFMRENSFGPNG